MGAQSALAALSALSQSTRLEIFRLLVRHEPDGLPAGDIARHLDVPQNTISAHLATLTRAGLLTSQRHSRQIVYRACLPRLRDLMLFPLPRQGLLCRQPGTLRAPGRDPVLLLPVPGILLMIITIYTRGAPVCTYDGDGRRLARWAGRSHRHDHLVYRLPTRA